MGNCVWNGQAPKERAEIRFLKYNSLFNSGLHNQQNESEGTSPDEAFFEILSVSRSGSAEKIHRRECEPVLLFFTSSSPAKCSGGHRDIALPERQPQSDGCVIFLRKKSGGFRKRG
jgi:hypothetical protein